jgi:Alginate export
MTPTPIAKLLLMASTSLALSASFAANAQEADSLADAITNGDAYIDARYRLESVSQDNLTENGLANTLRTKLGYKTGVWKGISGVLEFEHSAEIADGDYNNTINGKGTYPVIADPNHTEVNQAYLAYTGISKTTVAVGRQALNLGTQRFVGTVGWRQNDQTFDAGAIINNSIEDLTFVYGYVWNVNRIFGNDHPMGDLETKTNVVDVTYKGIKGLTINAYGLMIDLDAIGAKGLNTNTFGIRASGSQDLDGGTNILYAAEYASQSDAADNPTDYSTKYYNLEAGVGFKGLTLKGGIETLGSDNGIASFSTPLATLHKFNGWADKFLGTPANGLRDLYASAAYGVKDTGSALDGTTFAVIYHDFKSDVGGVHHGSEWDASVATKVDRFNVLFKFAKYNADMWSVDTTKFWMQVATKF